MKTITSVHSNHSSILNVPNAVCLTVSRLLVPPGCHIALFCLHGNNCFAMQLWLIVLFGIQWDIPGKQQHAISDKPENQFYFIFLLRISLETVITLLVPAIILIVKQS